MAKRKHCSYCDGEDHTSFYCTKKPRDAISPRGPYYWRMRKVRQEWFKLNPPDHPGYYYCWLCGKALRKEETELDHVLARSRHPELRFELTNLRPCCHACNQDKGSKEMKGFFE